jgi:hypothetical protein
LNALVAYDRRVDEDELQRELEATVAAREELGPEHDAHLISGFLARIDKEIDRRVDEKLASRPTGRRRRVSERELGIFVPLFVIAGIFGGPAGIFAVAGVLALVLLMQNFRR